MSQTFAPISPRYVRPMLVSGNPWPTQLANPLSFLFWDPESSEKVVQKQRLSMFDLLDDMVVKDRKGRLESSYGERWGDFSHILSTYLNDQLAGSLLRDFDASDTRLGKPASHTLQVARSSGIPRRSGDGKGMISETEFDLPIPATVFDQVNPQAWNDRIITVQGDPKDYDFDANKKLRFGPDSLRFRDPTWEGGPKGSSAPGGRGRDVVDYFKRVAQRAAYLDSIRANAMYRTLRPGAMSADQTARRFAESIRLVGESPIPLNDPKRVRDVLAWVTANMPGESVKEPSPKAPVFNVAQNVPTREQVERSLPLNYLMGKKEPQKKKKRTPESKIEKALDPVDPLELPVADDPMPGTGHATQAIERALHGNTEHRGRGGIYLETSEEKRKRVDTEREVGSRDSGHLDVASPFKERIPATEGQRAAYGRSFSFAMSRVKDFLEHYAENPDWAPESVIERGEEFAEAWKKRRRGLANLLRPEQGESRPDHINRVVGFIQELKKKNADPRITNDSRTSVDWILDYMLAPRKSTLTKSQFSPTMERISTVIQNLGAMSGKAPELLHNPKKYIPMLTAPKGATEQVKKQYAKRMDRLLDFIRKVAAKRNAKGRDTLQKRPNPALNRFEELETSHRKKGQLAQRLYSEDAIVRELDDTKRSELFNRLLRMTSKKRPKRRKA